MQIDTDDLPQFIFRGARIAYARLRTTDLDFEHWIRTISDRDMSDNDAFVCLAAATGFELPVLEGLSPEEREALEVFAATGRAICECLEILD